MRLIGKVLAVLFGLCLLAVATDLAWGKIEERRFDARVAAIKERGEPVDPRDLRERPVPDTSNVLAGLEAACHWLREEPDRGAPIALFEKLDRNGKPPTKADQANLDRYFEHIGPYFRMVDEALARPAWRADSDPEHLIDSIESLQEVNEQFLERVRSDRVAQGMTRRAAHAAHVALALARPASPYLIGTLEQYSMLAGPQNVLLAAYRKPGFNARRFRALVDPELMRALPVRGPPRKTFIAERVFLISLLRGTPNDRDSSLPLRYRFCLGRPFLYRIVLSHLDHIEDALSSCPTTPERAAGYWRSRPRESSEKQFSDVDWDWYRQTFLAYACAVAKMRLTRVAMAVLESKQRSGSWPASLKEIAPLLQDGVPEDPFGAGAFSYERTRSGVRLGSADARNGIYQDGLTMDLSDESGK